MTYTALARKWRPRTFADLIGQEAVVTALGNALREQRIAQAYLFSGIRGVGKTSAARLLAKALNCVEAPTAEPCNSCPSCLEIASGASMDVLEIDAATYSRVEQIRDLTEGLRYGPARERWKVVILDEVHRLSRQAFDALLKIVEEPPPFLVFIFATTEIDAVPATVLSRCQEFHFRRVPALLLSTLLRTLSEAETLTASDAALRILARAAEGSVRDAVALLDQLATFGEGTITEEAALALLGGGDLSTLPDLLGAILAGQRDGILETTTRIETEGWDPRAVHHRLLGLVRDALHLAAGADSSRLDLGEDERKRLVTLAGEAGYETLLRLLHHLLVSEPMIRRSEIPTLALEIAWLRAAELPRLQALEQYLAGAPATASTPTLSQPAPAAQRSVSAAESPNPPSRAERLPVAAPSSRASDPLRAVLDAVTQRREVLAARLRSCEGLRIEANQLVIRTTAEDADAFARPAAQSVLDEAVAEVLGPAARWRVEPVAASPVPAAAVERKPVSGITARAAAAPEVQAVLEIFNATIESVAVTATEDEEQS